MAKTIPITVTPFDATVTFRLRRKAEALGPASVDHWWMPTTTVYPGPKSQPANYRAVVDGFWQLCRQAASDAEADVADSYLLARLLPYVRPLGSRRVVADARLRRRIGRGVDPDVGALDRLLRADPLAPITEVEFRDRTADAIGPLAMTTEECGRYLRFADELLAGPRRRLPDDPEGAVAELRRTWTGWAAGFGRRKGRDEDKRVLDVLSYEARAALHRCYSAVWECILLPHLQGRFDLSPESSLFLAFWHQEQSRRPSDPGAPAYFHLFHGHSIGLHPAGSGLIRTPTGKSLLGTWVRAACEPDLTSANAAHRRAAAVDLGRAYGRLLRGLLLAAFFYAGRRIEANQDRKGSTRRRPLRGTEHPIDPDD